MNKKIIITLIILTILLIFVSVGAGANIIEKIRVVPAQPEPVVPDSNATTNVYFDNTISETDYALDSKLAKAEEINKIENEKIEKIINKFYATEYKQLKEDSSNPNNLSSDGYYADESPEPKFYNLVLDIIEYKDLTDDEVDTLKHSC